MAASDVALAFGGNVRRHRVDVSVENEVVAGVGAATCEDVPRLVNVGVDTCLV
jgi:hypothetical protein